MRGKDRESDLSHTREVCSHSLPPERQTVLLRYTIDVWLSLYRCYIINGLLISVASEDWVVSQGSRKREKNQGKIMTVWEGGEHAVPVNKTSVWRGPNAQEEDFNQTQRELQSKDEGLQEEQQPWLWFHSRTVHSSILVVFVLLLLPVVYSMCPVSLSVSFSSLNLNPCLFFARQKLTHTALMADVSQRTDRERERERERTTVRDNNNRRGIKIRGSQRKMHDSRVFGDERTSTREDAFYVTLFANNSACSMSFCSRATFWSSWTQEERKKDRLSLFPSLTTQ